jgi:hypothetical protein
VTFGALSLRPISGESRDAIEAILPRTAALAQHHPVWLDVLAGLGEQPIGAAAFRGDRLAGWILGSVRVGRAGKVVNSMPWVAYGGPCVVAPDDDEAFRALLAWYDAHATAEGAAAVGIALSPFASESSVALVSNCFAASAIGRPYRFDNFAQVQALAPHPLQQVSKSRRDSLANLIRRAERANVVVAPCDDDATFDAWLEIYKARYAEIGAHPLPDEFHRAAFTHGRAAGIVEFWTARLGDQLLGGSLFLLGTDVVDYFSSAYLTTDSARALAPNNLLLSTAFTSLAARGRSWFNWQSSPGRAGVYRFKAGWGAEERPQLYLGRCDTEAPSLHRSTPTALAEDYPARFVVPFSWLRSAEAAIHE